MNKIPIRVKWFQLNISKLESKSKSINTNSNFKIRVYFYIYYEPK